MFSVNRSSNASLNSYMDLNSDEKMLKKASEVKAEITKTETSKMSQDFEVGKSNFTEEKRERKGKK